MKDKLFCYTLLLLIIFYYSQEVLLSGVGVIGQTLLAIIFSISLLYLVKILLSKNKLTGFMKIWLFFMIMYLFYFLLYDDYTEFGIIKMVLLNFLPFFPFYYFSERRILTHNHLKAFFFILLPVLIIKFNQSLNTLRFEQMSDDVVDNTVYLFIGLLPFVFLFKKKLLSFFLLIVIWYFMIQSAKRAAILCGIVAMALIVFEYLYSSESKSKIKRYVVSIFLFLAIGYFGYDLYQQNQFLIERMQLMLGGDSSGRDNLIETLFGVWYNSDSLIPYLFGYGYNASGLHSIHVSHNDWVDMLISFGLLGLFVYFTLFRSLFMQMFQKGWVKEKKIILILVVCIAIITSFTSRWYWSTFAYMQILILPYLLATYDKEM